jgi:predicted hydrocarbon binding protein
LKLQSLPVKGNLLSDEQIEIDVAKGEYYDSLFDSPIFLLNLKIYRAWHEGLSRVFGTGASTILYEMGKELGVNVIQSMKEKTKNPLKLASIGLKHASLLGWGEFEVTTPQLLKMATLKTMKVKVYDCFVAKAIGNKGQASCHLLRGFFTGASQTLLGGAFSCEETKCLSKGDAYCEFILKRRQ